MRLAVSGASGLLGSSLLRSLPPAARAQTLRLTRSKEEATLPGRAWWSPEKKAVDVSALEGVTSVVHLAGAPVVPASGPPRWSEAHKKAVWDSRVNGTRLLVQALLQMDTKPQVLVTASGCGFYGADNGDAILSDDADKGSGFLADLSEAWEEETAPAAAAGVRVVNLRFAPVLSTRGGMLKQMLLPAMVGGGMLASGRQWVSWLSEADAVGIIWHALNTATLEGPIIAASPSPVRNADYAAELVSQVSPLGSMLPTLPMPELAVRAMFGNELAEEMLLASQRLQPDALLASGYHFTHDTLASALAAALDKK
eukprot:PLAT5802.1.p1 GENE.PLAT5802.1~~PLAT5802.1.p1  ORF type:complete len:319 (-),score=116.79 PLAT5802.1:184-1119(-)